MDNSQQKPGQKTQDDHYSYQNPENDRPETVKAKIGKDKNVVPPKGSKVVKPVGVIDPRP